MMLSNTVCQLINLREVVKSWWKLSQHWLSSSAAIVHTPTRRLKVIQVKIKYHAQSGSKNNWRDESSYSLCMALTMCKHIHMP